MKNRILFIFLIFYLPVSAQIDYLPFAGMDNSEKEIKNEYYADISLGFTLQSPHALKANISVNNILFRRFGAYSSLESDPSLIFGLTATITPWSYLFGGIDLFSKNGITNKSIKNTRKEVGAGFIPYKWIVIRAGYSSSIGPTLAVGAKIPIQQLFNEK